MLLIGVGGCGKNSITKLASFAAECNVFEITLSRGYSEMQFREDLKQLYNRIGVENKKTVFLFTSAQVCSRILAHCIVQLTTCSLKL